MAFVAGAMLPGLQAEKGGACTMVAVTAVPPWERFGTSTIDRLGGDLSAARMGLFEAEVDGRCIESERVRLIDQVVMLEADRRALKREAEKWRRRCLQVEQECMELSTSQDAAQGDLRDAQLKQRDLAVKTIEGRIATAEAESATCRVQAEARGHQWEIARLERALEEKNDEVEALRRDIRDVRAEGEAAQVSLERLRAEDDRAKRDCEAHREARRVAEERVIALESHAGELSVKLGAASAQIQEFAAETAAERARGMRLEETNRRLRLDLQEVINQAVRSGETQFYAGGGDPKRRAPGVNEDSHGQGGLLALRLVDGNTDAPKQQVLAPIDPPTTEALAPTDRCFVASPKSPQKARPDYFPKGNPRGRQVKMMALETRRDAFDRVDSLAANRTQVQ